MENQDKEIFPTGLAQGVKTKTNYNLVGLVFSGFVIGFIASCVWLLSPLKEILAVFFAIAIIGSLYWLPRIMKQIPPSEEFKLSLAELGFSEIDGKMIPTEKLKPTSAENPLQLPPKEKEDGAKD